VTENECGLSKGLSGFTEVEIRLEKRSCGCFQRLEPTGGKSRRPGCHSASVQPRAVRGKNQSISQEIVLTPVQCRIQWSLVAINVTQLHLNLALFVENWSYDEDDVYIPSLDELTDDQGTIPSPECRSASPQPRTVRCEDQKCSSWLSGCAAARLLSPSFGALEAVIWR
jgi:hypothetical protein